MSFFTWKKGTNTLLGRYFSSSEFECKCSSPECVDQKISKLLIEKLDAVREALKEPITITSGFRCKSHQESLRQQGYQTSQGLSQHELGAAADIQSRNMIELKAQAGRHFLSIGIALTFLHVDIRNRKREWFYSRKAKQRSEGKL